MYVYMCLYTTGEQAVASVDLTAQLLLLNGVKIVNLKSYKIKE